MDGLESSGTDAGANDPAPHQPSTPAQATTTTPNTAPGESVEREALRRLRAGEKPDQIRTDIHARGSEKPTAPTPGVKKDEPAAPQPTGDKPAEGETYGLDAKELAALKRGKFDLAILSSIPPANRKTIARGMMQAQSEQDRQFQAAKAAGQPAGTGEANPANPQQDGPTGTPAKEQGKAAAAAPEQDAPAASFLTPFQVPAAELETLADIGGKDFADATSKLFQGLAAHSQQGMTQVASLLNHVFERFERQDFDAALTSLRKQPGFENVATTPDEQKALRERASLLVRTAGNLDSYTLEQGVSDAAASLYRVNAQQATQATLARARTAALQSSPDRGNGTHAAPRQMSETDRMRAALAGLRGGKTPAQIQAELGAS